MCEQINPDCRISKPVINIDSSLSMKNDAEWYKNILFYHVWLSSFNDSDGDGTGDIKGVTDKLDYIADLGCKGIWLSPFFECDYKGENMHGYDAVDFYSVNPRIGTLDDLKELLSESHERNIRVIFDLPMNHTSYQHPWFIDSKRGGKYKDWYVWNHKPGEGWQIIWNEDRAKVTWHKHDESNYYGVFSKYMPDLNFTNQEVRDEMVKILTYWLDMGFDGVRIDGARYIYEDGPDKIYDTERTHCIFKVLRKEIFDRYQDAGYAKFLIAEAWADKDIIKEYYGKGDEFHSCFNFPLASVIPDLINNKKDGEEKFNKIIKYQIRNYPDKYIGGVFLTNHDLAGDRVGTAFKGNVKKIALSYALQIFLPGTPFIYYGNELGMENADVKGDMKVRASCKNTTKELQNFCMKLEPGLHGASSNDFWYSKISQRSNVTTSQDAWRAVTYSLRPARTHGEQ
jgi:alpha-amylase